MPKENDGICSLRSSSENWRRFFNKEVVVMPKTKEEDTELCRILSDCGLHIFGAKMFHETPNLCRSYDSPNPGCVEFCYASYYIHDRHKEVVRFSDMFNDVFSYEISGNITDLW